MAFDEIVGIVTATPDGAEVLRTSSAGTLPHSSITICNGGPGTVTDIVISKQTTNLFACPWVDIYGAANYVPDASGFMSSNVLEATVGLLPMEPGTNGIISFNHWNPYLWRVVVTSDAPADVTIFCRR